jgi:hypothetical protein
MQLRNTILVLSLEMSLKYTKFYELQHALNNELWRCY